MNPRASEVAIFVPKKTSTWERQGDQLPSVRAPAFSNHLAGGRKKKRSRKHPHFYPRVYFNKNGGVFQLDDFWPLLWKWLFHDLHISILRKKRFYRNIIMLFLFDGGFPCFRTNFWYPLKKKSAWICWSPSFFARGRRSGVALRCILFGEEVTSLESVGL